MADKDLIAKLQSQIRTIEAGESAAEESQSRQRGAHGRFRQSRTGKRADSQSHAQSGAQSHTDRLADPEQALRKIVALVNVSDRSECALRERLAREGFATQAIEGAVLRAKDYGFIDDARFADVLVRSRLSQGKGSAGIERELVANGIDPTDVSGWPYEYPVSAEEELDRALDILKRKPPHSKNKRDGAFRKLVQKGYPISVASSAARIWSDKTPNQ